MPQVQNERNAIVGFGRVDGVLSDCVCEINAEGPGVVTITFSHASGTHVLNMDVGYADLMAEVLHGQAQASRRMCMEAL